MLFHSVPSPNYSQLHNSVLERLKKHLMWPCLVNSLTLTHSSPGKLECIDVRGERERSSARAEVSARALRSDARTNTCLVLVGQRASFIDKNNSERTFEDIRKRIFCLASRKIHKGKLRVFPTDARLHKRMKRCVPLYMVSYYRKHMRLVCLTMC